MKHTTLLYLSCLILLCVTFSCKKSKQAAPNKTTTTTDTPTTIHYTSGVAGNWIETGGGDYDSYSFYISGDVFRLLKITIVDSNNISVDGDVLTYQSKDTNTHNVVFKGTYDDEGGKFYQDRTLTYNYADNSIKEHYDASGGGAGGAFGENINLDGQLYTINPILNDHIAQIAITKNLSGTVYDTSDYRYPPNNDTSYTVNDNIHFSIVDSATLSYDKDYIQVGDNLLHYKSLDEATSTIIFQTYHALYSGNPTTTLTYNYATNTFVFQQTIFAQGHHASLRLE